MSWAPVAGWSIVALVILLRPNPVWVAVAFVVALAMAVQA